MLNKEKHKLIMGRILKDIYTDTTIAPLLGFKGGTCAYLFYGLPRFSADLDFDLISSRENQYKLILEKLHSIAKNYGKIKNSFIKRFTIFLLLSYGEDDRNIKVEVNIRKLHKNIKDYYELKKYLGISMQIAQKDYIFSSKLAALTSRSETAMRDVYDIYYFAKNNWEIDNNIIKTRTGKKTTEHLKDCIETIEKIKDNDIPQGLGEFLGEKEKAWVKKNLKTEVIFLLKNYISALSA